MLFKRGAHRSIRSRARMSMGMASGLFLGTAALAITAATYTVIEPTASLSAMTDALTGGTDSAGFTTIAENGTTTLQLAASDQIQNAAIIRPLKLGINLSKPFYWTGSRAFSNLLAVDKWRFRAAGQTSGSSAVPASQLDANMNIIKLNPGEMVFINLATPGATFRGQSVDIRCRWLGNGQVVIPTATNVANVSYGANTARFTWLPGRVGKTESAQLHILSIDSADPLRKLDCREVNADANALFDPTFLANVKRYNTLRFMWWQRTVDNAPVTWATRTRPERALLVGSDGIALEYMIELANQAQTDAWFAMPWNADEAYYREFAKMVRDRLDPSLKVYVEVSNEVWNTVYPVTKQATLEGQAAGFAKPLSYRLAQKTGEVMDIWSEEFAGQNSRLVRVLANQHTMDWRMAEMLAYGDTASKIDAIATAPFVPFKLDKETYNKDDLTSVFTRLQKRLTTRMEAAVQLKALADQYGKRYITYEAGQHVTGKDVKTNYRIQHDARMGKLYTDYLRRWRSVAGDLLMMFEDIDGDFSPNGMFGQLDFPGQPLSQAPKENAVQEMIRTIDNN